MNTQARQLFLTLFVRYPALEVCRDAVEQAFLILRRCYQAQGKVLICGNGGSAADAEHIVGELMKSFVLKRAIPTDDRRRLIQHFPESGTYLADHLQQALPAISLAGHLALSTAFQNDVAADMVFAQQVYGYGRPGDVLLAISTSGNSRNVIYALQVAQAQGLATIGLTGQGGGRMNDLCDVTLCAPAVETSMVQEYHLPIYHVLCLMLEAEFFGENVKDNGAMRSGG
jgi:D-sedoheptulose 7-phosphate isomerase